MARIVAATSTAGSSFISIDLRLVRPRERYKGFGFSSTLSTYLSSLCQILRRCAVTSPSGVWPVRRDLGSFGRTLLRAESKDLLIADSDNPAITMNSTTEPSNLLGTSIGRLLFGNFIPAHPQLLAQFFTYQRHTGSRNDTLPSPISWGVLERNRSTSRQHTCHELPQPFLDDFIQNSTPSL
jgi:hypothetical protein